MSRLICCIEKMKAKYNVLTDWLEAFRIANADLKRRHPLEKKLIFAP